VFPEEACAIGYMNNLAFEMTIWVLGTNGTANCVIIFCHASDDNYWDGRHFVKHAN